VNIRSLENVPPDRSPAIKVLLNPAMIIVVFIGPAALNYWEGLHAWSNHTR